MTELCAAIFDWDDTMVNSMEGIRLATNHALSCLRDMGFEAEIGRGAKGYAQWTAQETQLRFSGTAFSFFDEAFGQYGPAVSELALNAFHEKLSEVHLANLTFLKGAKETIALLRKNSIPVAIVSNKEEELLKEEVAYLLGKEFPGLAVKGAVEGKRGKPYPDPLFDALKDMNISAGLSVWMIGDSVSDVKAGVKSGSYPVLFGSANAQKVKDLQNGIPDKSVVNGKDVGYVKNHSDLRKLIAAAKIVAGKPYHQKNNPRNCWKPPAS